MFKNGSRSLCYALVTLVVLGAAPLAAFGSVENSGAVSPEALAKRLVATHGPGDLVPCVAPQERAYFAGGVMMVTEMSVEFSDNPKAKKAYKTVLDKYGIEPIPNGFLQDMKGNSQKLLGAVDHDALIKDFSQVLEQYSPGGLTALEFSGELTNLQTNGDASQGMLGDKPVQFRRVDDRWYWSVPD